MDTNAGQVAAQVENKAKTSLPKGRPPGSKNKPKANSKPRKPYTSTKRTKCAAKEDLLERLKREVTEQALAVIPCEQFENWLASYAAHEGNDYIRKDQHEHTYNSTHHRVVTYGCNHVETTPKDKGDAQISAGADTGTRRVPKLPTEDLLQDFNDSDPDYELIRCDAILDIYYFYESSVYQIIQLGEHEHPPMNIPRHLFGIGGMPQLNTHA